MRLFFLLLFFSVFLNGHAQLLLADEEWFGLSNFFNQKEIQEKQIRAIHIKIEDKKDGEIILHKGNFLHYEFNENGQLTESLKSIPLARKIDTSRVIYSYDSAHRLYKKSEKYGPFYFTYYYFFENGQLSKEIKIDDSHQQNDTLHLRFFEIIKSASEVEIKTLNQKRDAFKTNKKAFNKQGLLVEEKTSFRRGRSYVLHQYNYSNNKLSLLKEESYFVSKKEKLSKFFYTDELYQEVNLFEEGEIIKKRGFTYREDGLIKAIVERNYQEKSIRIYHFMYRISKL